MYIFLSENLQLRGIICLKHKNESLLLKLYAEIVAYDKFNITYLNVKAHFHVFDKAS